MTETTRTYPCLLGSPKRRSIEETAGVSQATRRGNGRSRIAGLAWQCRGSEMDQSSMINPLRLGGGRQHDAEADVAVGADLLVDVLTTQSPFVQVIYHVLDSPTGVKSWRPRASLCLEARLDILSDDFLQRVAALEQKNLVLETLTCP